MEALFFLLLVLLAAYCWRCGYRAGSDRKDT